MPSTPSTVSRAELLASPPPAVGRPSGRPRVKICGVTDETSTWRAIELGAELIGVNFYPPSPRSLEVEPAAELVAAVRRRLASAPSDRTPPLFVGVFVDESVDEAVEIACRVGLDLLQFHGDETPEALRPVAARALKAFRVESRLDAGILARWLDLGLWGMVIDSRHPTLYGGSGQSWDFSSLGRLDPETQARLAQTRVLVAGGIRPGTAAAAVRAADPWGIDVASGVESSAGIKDPELMASLFQEIRHG